jgi:hypothetical protein
MGCQNSIPHRVHHRDEGLPVAVAPAVVQPTAEGEGQALAPMALPLLPVIRAVSLRHGLGVPVWPGPLELTVACEPEATNWQISPPTSGHRPA